MDNSTSATIHVYGGRAALTIEPCMNSASDFHTLMLEIAPKTERGSATILTKSSKKRINHLFYKP